MQHRTGLFSTQDPVDTAFDRLAARDYIAAIGIEAVGACMARILILGVTAGQDVATLQEALNLLGLITKPASRYTPLTADGHFGWKTQQRLKEFQSVNGMAPDGIVTTLTWQRIRHLLRRFPGLVSARPSNGVGSQGDGSVAAEPIWGHALPRFMSVVRGVGTKYMMFDAAMATGASRAVAAKERTGGVVRRSGPGGSAGSTKNDKDA